MLPVRLKHQQGGRVNSRAARLVVVVLAVVVAGAVGVWAGSRGVIGFHPGTMTADGSTGDKVITLESGGVSYGAKDSVAWTDSLGAIHDSGWPDCLPPSTVVKGVTFLGGMVWYGDVGQAEILWVDCRGH
jgi:hypothetical protein